MVESHCRTAGLRKRASVNKKGTNRRNASEGAPSDLKLISERRHFGKTCIDPQEHFLRTADERTQHVAYGWDSYAFRPWSDG